jgi:hypothetical protein
MLEKSILDIWIGWFNENLPLYTKDYSKEECIRFVDAISWYDNMLFHQPEDAYLRTMKEKYYYNFENLSLLERIQVFGVVREAYLKLDIILTDYRIHEVVKNILKTRNIKEEFETTLEDHSIFKNIGDLLIDSKTETFEYDFDELIQLIDSNIDIFKYIRFIDFYYKEFTDIINEEDLKRLLLKLFKIKNFSYYYYPNLKAQVVDSVQVLLLYKKILKNINNLELLK